jgi:hypothetical protein
MAPWMLAASSEERNTTAAATPVGLLARRHGVRANIGAR